MTTPGIPDISIKVWNRWNVPPLWICPDCGARNPLHRDTCLHCGGPAPEWKEDERYDAPERRA